MQTVGGVIDYGGWENLPRHELELLQIPREHQC